MIGEVIWLLSAGLVANVAEDGLDAVAPIGVAVRAPANRSRVCKMRFAVSVVTALVTGLEAGVRYAAASASRAKAPGPGLCVCDSKRRGVVTRARSRSRSTKVNSRSRFRLVRGGVGALSAGSRIAGRAAVRPLVPKREGVPEAPYDRRTDAYPGDVVVAATPTGVVVAPIGGVVRSRTGVSCASRAASRSNVDCGLPPPTAVAPKTTFAVSGRSICSLSSCPRLKNSLICVNGVGDSVPSTGSHRSASRAAVTAVDLAFASLANLVAVPVALSPPTLAPFSFNTAILPIASFVAVEVPPIIAPFASASSSRLDASHSPDSLRRNPPTSAPANLLALFSGVPTRRKNPRDELRGVSDPVAAVEARPRPSEPSSSC